MYKVMFVDGTTIDVDADDYFFDRAKDEDTVITGNVTFINLTENEEIGDVVMVIAADTWKYIKNTSEPIKNPCAQ